MPCRGKVQTHLFGADVLDTFRALHDKVLRKLVQQELGRVSV